MSANVLIVSQNDRWHPLEELGDQMAQWLETMEGVQVEVQHDKEVLTDEKLSGCNVCVLCTTVGELTESQEQAVVSFTQQGGVLMGIHSATVVDEQHEAFIELIGGRFVHHSPFHEFQVQVTVRDHPITQGVSDFQIEDELYVLDRAPADAQILATAHWEDQAQPMLYVKPYGKGTVVYHALGHDGKAYANPAFQRLVIQSLAWVCQSLAS